MNHTWQTVHRLFTFMRTAFLAHSGNFTNNLNYVSNSLNFFFFIRRGSSTPTIVWHSSEPNVEKLGLKCQPQGNILSESTQ